MKSELQAVSPKNLVVTREIVIVDHDGRMVEAIKEAGVERVAVRLAGTCEQARLMLKQRRADVVMIAAQLEDNRGIELMRELRGAHAGTDFVVMSRMKRHEITLEAFRAGAVDVVALPAAAGDVKGLLAGLLMRREASAQADYRNARLRRVCRQLNKARHEIRQQVDMLCNDLVRAYQDMAVQLNAAQVTAEFAAEVDNEVEVEGLLRKTMEWILKKLGPVNAAIYLPDADRSFALGAYLNLDTDADAGLIAAIGETLVKQADTAAHAIIAEHDQVLTELFGEEGRALKGRAWLAAPCVPGGVGAGRQSNAVLVIFRKQAADVPQSDPAMQMVVETVSPVLGERIQAALGLYHRMHPYLEDEC